MALIGEARDLLALYRKNEDLINIGAYTPRSNPKIDKAISKYAPIMEFLRQLPTDSVQRSDAFKRLRVILRGS